MKNEEFSIIEIIWVIFIILLALYALYYYYNNPSQTYQNVSAKQSVNSHNTYGNTKISGAESKAKANYNITSPPKLTNLYNEENQDIHSKNDIDIINKSNMLLYKDGYQSTNPTFETELINTKMSGEFSPDLENVYTQDLVENTDTKHDYNEIFDYCVKPNKGDLPIANVPLYALKDSNCPLKLSENFNKL